MQTKTVNFQVPVELEKIGQGIIQVVQDVKQGKGIVAEVSDAVPVLLEAIENFAELKEELSSPAAIAAWAALFAGELYAALKPVEPSNPPVPDPVQAPVAPAPLA